MSIPRNFIALLALCQGSALLAAPFQPNGLVVASYGSSCNDNTGCPVFLHEYDLSTGQLRQTIPLPATASGNQQPFTLEAAAGGQLSLSQDGRFLSLTGFARPVVAGSNSRLARTAASEVPRVVARIDGQGNVDTSTTLGATGFGQVQPIAAASADGSGYWVVGENGGVRFAQHGANTSNQVSASFAFNLFAVVRDGLVWTTPDEFVSRAIKIATLPAVNQANTTSEFIAQGANPGQSSSGGALAGIALLDVSPELPGVDLIYAADVGREGIRKYRKDSAGGWNLLGRVDLSNTYGITARLKPGLPQIVEIYVTADCGTGLDQRVCLLEDSAGYDGTLTATADVFIPPLASGGFRGVALTPSSTPATFAIGPGITGAWFDRNQAGHGLFIEVLPNQRFLAWWFTFSPSGEQAWFGGVGLFEDNVAVVPLTKTAGGRFIPNFDPAAISNPPFGTLTFTYTDCDNGLVEFDLPAPYGQGSMVLNRLSSPAGLSCP